MPTILSTEQRKRFPIATPQPVILDGVAASEIHLRDLSYAGVILGEWQVQVPANVLGSSAGIYGSLSFAPSGYTAFILYNGVTDGGSWSVLTVGDWELCGSSDPGRPWVLVLKPIRGNPKDPRGLEVLRGMSLPHDQPIALRVRPLDGTPQRLEMDGDRGQWSAMRIAGTRQ